MATTHKICIHFLAENAGTSFVLMNSCDSLFMLDPQGVTKVFEDINLEIRDLSQYKNFLPQVWGMMTSSNGIFFRLTGPVWGESTSHWWFYLPKASDMELSCFLWSSPEQTAEQTIETLIAQIGPLSFQAAIEHKPRQVRWGDCTLQWSLSGHQHVCISNSRETFKEATKENLKWKAFTT